MRLSHTHKEFFDALNDIYSLCNPCFHGSMRAKGEFYRIIARLLRKRQILQCKTGRNGDWRWVAKSAPTHLLAENIRDDYNKYYEHKNTLKVKSEAIESLTPCPDNARTFHNESVQTEKNGSDEEKKCFWIDSSRTKVSSALINKLDDQFLVNLLRQRGYTVTATKTIEL